MRRRSLRVIRRSGRRAGAPQIHAPSDGPLLAISTWVRRRVNIAIGLPESLRGPQRSPSLLSVPAQARAWA